MCCFISFYLFLQLILIFQPPVGDDLMDSGVEGGVPTIGDISAPKKMHWDENESDGSFSLASILDQIKKNKSIYGPQTQRIKD